MIHSILPKFFYILLALLFFGCLVVSAQSVDPKYGGTLRVALPAELPALDPTTNSSAVIDRVLYNNVYQGLVRIDRGGDIVPSLAKDWETSNQGKTYTFRLREGVTFHNGDKFSAQDVKYTLDRARNQTAAVANPEYYSSIEDVVVVSPLTVRIELSEPSSIFLFNLARGDSVILPKGIKDLSTHPVGTGPFKFVRRREGTSVTLTRYEDYYDESLPYLDKVVFEIIGDVNTRIAALRAGDIDVIPYLSGPQYASTLQDAEGIKVLSGVTTWEVILAMNNSRQPFSNPLVRKAINYAIDREEIIKGVTFGFGVPIGSHMSPSNPNYLDLSWLYSSDPERAKELLRSAGYPEGFEATLTLPAPYELSVNSGKIISQQLRKVGIDLELKKIGWGQWYDKVFQNAQYDLTIIGHSEAFDISIYAQPNYYFRYDNERLRQVIRRAEREMDGEIRRKLYAVAQWIIGKEVPVAFLFSAPSLPAMRESVQNWWVDYPIPAADVTEVWKEK